LGIASASVNLDAMVEAGSHTAPLRLVCFALGAQELAFPIADVRETVPLQPITRVFLTPACIAGVFSLRGEIVPALELGVLLGVPASTAHDDSRIVVIETRAGTAGILADRLCDLRTLDQPLDPPPANVAAQVAALLLGVAATPSGTVRVLDASALLTAGPLRALASPHGAGAEEGTSV
jgi:purine-binding chemotaxis protein CheW